MKARLCLRLGDGLIQRARTFAWRRGQSLSSLVEAYFESLPAPDDCEAGRAPDAVADAGSPAPRKYRSYRRAAPPGPNRVL